MMELPGIGRWTAEYIAMRALKAPDIFLAGDLVLRKILADGEALPKEREIRERAKLWAPLGFPFPSFRPFPESGFL